MSLFRGDGGPESWLDAMNLALAPLEREFVARFEAPDQPVLFIVGAPRSGTTLLTQLLISQYGFGYISNLAARFWNAPALGLKLAASLAGERPPAVGLDSDYGQVSGYEGPHEFGHFWQRWFEYGESHRVEPDRLRRVDRGFLLQELAAIEAHFGSPTLYKNLAACGMNLDFLAGLLPGARFVHLQRDPLRVACSLLAGRKHRCGSREAWFSVRPPGYPRLRTLPWPEQIAGQVAAIERQIADSLSRLPAERWRRVGYDDLVASPAGVLQRIATWIGEAGGSLYRRDIELPRLVEPSPPAISQEEYALLEAACARHFPGAGRVRA